MKQPKPEQYHEKKRLTHYHVTAGDIIIVLPEHLHAIREISGQKMECENIIFRPELLSSDNHDVCFEKFLYPLFSGQIHTVVHIHPRLSTCAQRLSVSFHLPASFSGRKKRIIQHTATVTGQVEIHHHFHE